MSRTVLALLAGCGLTLSATAAVAEPPAADLALVVAPVAGAELVAGETAWLAWRRGPGLARFAQADEWEAFLSLDGGASFPVRLTPHLDLGRSRVAFRVPPVVSGDVRLLLRFGDEGVEREQPVPGRFRIVPARALLSVLRRRAPAAGEPARPGDRGVVLWAEGARDGIGWREVEAWDPLSTLTPACRIVPPLVLLAVAPERPRPEALRVAARVLGGVPRAGEVRRPPAATSAVQPLLLLVHRLNR